MKRTILTLLIVLICALPLFAQGRTETKQTSCTLGLDRAPELRGLRVGAPQSAVLARFPGASLEKADQFGVALMRFTVIDSGVISKGLANRDKGVQPDMSSIPGKESGFIIDSAKFPALKGLRRIRFRFVDGRLAYVQAAYDDSTKWESIDEFVETVAKILNLPAEWTAPIESDGPSSERELRCEGFVITGNLNPDPADTRIAAQLSVEDVAAAKTVAKRQTDVKEKAQQDAEAKRKNFKP